ncbi:MAG: DNA-processing protein DprA [Tatlockia sp.]|jgi:DNA processing protein
MDNKYCLLALNRIEHIGPRTLLTLLKRWPILEEMFRLSVAELTLAGLPDKMAQAIKRFPLEDVWQDLRWQEGSDHHLLTWFDANYPPLLKEIHDPPAVLYAKGKLNSLNQPTLAIVGTRKPSITGAETAKQFASTLSAQALTVVSGLALGIDAQAHQGCLEVNGKTIAVMGTGIDVVYPAKHRLLAQQITEFGLLLTEFPLKKSPKAGHFPRRNRIISGLSLATLVVEAAIRSGSLITARMALEQNRDVLAIPGSIHNPQARGCHYLLQQGAKLVTTCEEVLEELGLAKAQESHLPSQSLASEDKNLVKCIGFEITTVDQIISRSGLGVEAVACGLAALELQGIIKAVPGGYMRCII